MSPLRRGLLLLLAAPLALVAGTAAAAVLPTQPSVVVFTSPGATLGDLLSIPSVRALARAGGAGFATPAPRSGPSFRDAFPIGHLAPGAPPSATGLVLPAIPPRGSPTRAHAIAKADAAIQELARAKARPCTVVVTADLTPAMTAAGDELQPVVAARGPTCEGLLEQSGSPNTITSDSTRRTGVIAEPDVPFTVLTALGRKPSLGASIRFVDSPPPFELLEKHLANRRMTVPIQTAAGLYVTIAGLFAAAVLYLRKRSPRWLRTFAAWLTMSVAPLAIALLAAGRLPTLSYATVVPFVIVVTAAVTLLADLLHRRSLLLVPAAIGAVSLAYLCVEAIFGWSGALTPFLGGSELDGGRFFGLPNVYVGLLVGASLYVAQRLSVVWGAVLVVAVGFFAGLPGTGANLGGALTLFAAAGLWVIVRCRERLGWPKALAIAVAIVIVGMAAIFASHVYLTSSPTHGTRFVEGAGRTASGIWDTITHRLDVGFDLIQRNPFALLPVVGLLVVLAVVVRPTPKIRESFERYPVWRDAILVIVLTSVVAYVANDSGAAAVGLGFGLAVGGLLYVPLRDEPGNIETP